MEINGNLVFDADDPGEIRNAYLERLSAAPAFKNTEKGRIYFNTAEAVFYFNNGTEWLALGQGGGGGQMTDPKLIVKFPWE